MKRMWGAGAVLLVAAMGAYAAVVHTENVVETHATYADALAAGARDRGWLPDFVPATAFAIRDVHNLDSNGQWIRFAVPPAGIAPLANALPSLDPDDARARHRRPPRWRGSWTPEPGRHPVAGARASLSYHSTDDQHGRVWCVAVNRLESTVYGWTCGRAGP